MSGNLGDFIAKGVITIAEVQEGDFCLEDMGIMEIEPGQTIIKCESAKAVKPVGQANARIEEWDKGSAEWVLAEYASGKLLRDVDRDCDVEIAVTDLKERIAELEDELAATKRELKITGGQLSTTLNNWEQAKGKLRRERDELNHRRKMLDERDARTAEEVSAEQVGYWRNQAEKARSEAEYYREKLSAVLDLAHDIESAAR